MAFRFNYTTYDDLPTRAKNIVDDLGGLENALEYYKTNESFLNITSAGNKINLQLISLCENLIFEQNLLSPKEIRQEKEPAIPLNMQQLVDHYLIKKSAVTRRLSKFLNKIEEDAEFNKSIEYQANYIGSHFLNDYNFLSINKLGVTIFQEIESLRNELRNKAKYQHDDSSNAVKERDEISSLLYRRFAYSIPLEKIEKTFLKQFNSYSLPKLVKIFLKNLKLLPRIKKALELYYFSKKGIENENVGLLLNCTKERVRHLKLSFKEKILPDAIETVLKTLEGISYTLEVSNDDIVELLDAEPDDVDLYFNATFLKFIYIYINASGYFDLTDIISDSKVFVAPKNSLLICNNFADRVTLLDLFNFLDTEIYNFEIAEFEYDREILIQRFYDENDLIIESVDLHKIDNLIEKIVRTDWTDIEVAIKKSKKRKEKEDIYTAVHSFILKKNKPQKTKAILENLSENYFDISKEFLLHILNKNIARFQRVGNGYWTISKLNNNIHGSVREIVEKKIFESDIPLHISELHNHVNSLRPISIHSLRTNLQMEEYKIFAFFNCSFIGLSIKKYDDYWYNLPKTTANKIRLIYNSKIVFNSDEEKLEYFCQLFNYPKIHLKYLLETKTKT